MSSWLQFYQPKTKLYSNEWTNELILLTHFSGRDPSPTKKSSQKACWNQKKVELGTTPHQDYEPFLGSGILN